MTMGLILLGVMSLAVMFGFAKSSYKNTGLKDWLLYFIIIAFAVGIIVPVIRFSNMMSMSVGGFILPVLAMLALFVILIRTSDVMRGIASMLIVAAITFGLLLIMPSATTGQTVFSALLMGVVIGTFAFIVARSRTGAVFGIMGGAALGDLIFCLVDYYAISGGAFTLGSSLVYNTLFFAVIISACLAEIMLLLAKDSRSRRASSRRTSNFEAGIDEDPSKHDDDPFEDFKL